MSELLDSAIASSSREGFLVSLAAEKVTAIDGYYAYCGAWSVDAAGSAVTHRILNSLCPGERGEDGVRQLSIEGNRLILTAKAREMGELHGRRLVWERVAPD